MNTIPILLNCRKNCKQGKTKISSSTNTIQESASMRYAVSVRNNATRTLPKISCLTNNAFQLKGQSSSQFIQQQILIKQQQQQDVCNIQTRYYQTRGKYIPLSKMVCITKPQIQTQTQTQTITNFPLYQIPAEYIPIAGGFQTTINNKDNSQIITNYTYLQMVTNGLIDPNNPFQQNFPLVTFTNRTNQTITYQTPIGFTDVPGGFINYNYNNNGASIVVMVITDPNMVTATNPSDIINII